MNASPCKHIKHHIVEREFFMQKPLMSGTRIICKKCGKNIFIKDEIYGVYKPSTSLITGKTERK